MYIDKITKSRVAGSARSRVFLGGAGAVFFRLLGVGVEFVLSWSRSRSFQKWAAPATMT